MATQIITGDDVIDANLAKLSTSIANKLAKYALRAALTVISRAERAAAPVGATGAVKKSIGTQLKKSREGFTAKAGINVGKRTKQRGKYAPHAHLVALGTKARYRKTIGGRFAFIRNPKREQLSTGVMPSNPFIRQAYAQSRAAATAAMRNKTMTALQKEVAKLKK